VILFLLLYAAAVATSVIDRLGCPDVTAAVISVTGLSDVIDRLL